MTAMQLLQLDPATLLVDVNVRTDAALGKDFLASVAEFGVLVPIVAVRAEQGVRVGTGTVAPWRLCRPGTPRCRCM